MPLSALTKQKKELVRFCILPFGLLTWRKRTKRIIIIESVDDSRRSYKLGRVRNQRILWTLQLDIAFVVTLAHLVASATLNQTTEPNDEEELRERIPLPTAAETRQHFSMNNRRDLSFLDLRTKIIR